MHTTNCLYVAIAASCLLGAARAAPPSTSAYATDPQSEYVQDTTADSISSLNMVLCVFGSMGAGSMVNAGPYIALVDMNKCDTKKASAAAAGATNYATAVLDVTRTSNNDPMLGKVWLSMSEQGNAVDVFIHLSATESPSSTQPYGLFRLDYLGKKNGVIGFNGFVDSQASSISQFETGNNSNNTAMALSASSTTAGAGTITTVGRPAGDNARFAQQHSLLIRRRLDRTHRQQRRDRLSELANSMEFNHPGLYRPRYADLRQQRLRHNASVAGRQRDCQRFQRQAYFWMG